MEILIINGRYPDFEKGVFISGNIGIDDGKIKYVGIEEPKAELVIDAKDRVVSPGFIDIHMHEESIEKDKHEYCIANYMLKQGVTLAVGGNCGLARQSVKEFKDFIQKMGGSPVNYMMFSGYNSYRNELVSNHYGQTSRKQRNIIREKMRQDIKEGACGISFGIEYDPGISFDEILYAAGCDSDRDLLVAAHYRTDCGGNLDGVREMIRLQSMIDKRFQISHLSSCAAIGWMKEALALINDAIEKDSRLSYDTYPYHAFSTYIGTTVFEEGCLDMWGKDYSDILLLGEPYKNVYCTKQIFEDARANYPEMPAVAFVMNENEIAMAIANKHGMIGSDGILEDGNGHPRCAGAFPRVLGKYVREQGNLSLLDALRKMTLEPAKRLLEEKRRGIIAEGAVADIVIFDPELIADGAEFENIDIANRGIQCVIVNGRVALRDNQIIDARAGKFIHFKRKNDEV